MHCTCIAHGPGVVSASGLASTSPTEDAGLRIEPSGDALACPTRQSDSAPFAGAASSYFFSDLVFAQKRRSQQQRCCAARLPFETVVWQTTSHSVPLQPRATANRQAGHLAQRIKVRNRLRSRSRQMTMWVMVPARPGVMTSAKALWEFVMTCAPLNRCSTPVRDP